MSTSRLEVSYLRIDIVKPRLSQLRNVLARLPTTVTIIEHTAYLAKGEASR